MKAPNSSVVIASLAPWHEAHQPARAALLAGGVGIACPSRLRDHLGSQPYARGASDRAGRGVEALELGFPQPWLTLEAADQREALQRAVKAGVRGGALYDALIAATASKHGATLLSADRRARGVYQAMGVEATFIDA